MIMKFKSVAALLLSLTVLLGLSGCALYVDDTHNVAVSTVASDEASSGEVSADIAEEEVEKPVVVASYCEPNESFFNASAPTSFYEDKTFQAKAGFFNDVFVVDGTWDYSDETGLTLAYSDGTAIPVTEEDGIYSWQLELSTSMPVAQIFDNRLSVYDLTSSCNAILGTSYTLPEEPAFTVNFASGNDNVSGETPASFTVHTGESFTLPENPYSGQYTQFSGWSVNGTLYQAGDAVQVEGYYNYDITGSWDIQHIADAVTQDDYKYSYEQRDGIPMILYADGTVRLHYANLVTDRGFWEVTEDDNGQAVLSIYNEMGIAPENLISATEEDGELVYSQEGFYYDWGQPDIGYGSGIFRTLYTHRIDLAAFLSAYNETYGTSYESVSVGSGTAVFTEQDDPSSGTLGMIMPF